MKLKTQITLFFIIILIFSLGSMTLLSYYQMKSIFGEQLEDKLKNIVYYASEDYLVKSTLAGYDLTAEDLNEHIEKIRQETDVDFIVVFDMDGIRYTHPVKENISKKFRGGDEERVLKNAENYVSEARGTLGISKRAFAPVFYEGKQVGAVSVGSTLAEINRETFVKTKQFIPFIAIGLILGVYCAFILTSNIKYSILGMEPNEITLLFKEKETILENVKEGIITLNEDGRLIQYNKEAARIIGLTEKNMNMNVVDYIKGNKIFNVINDGEALDDFEIKIRPGVTILCKYNILRNDKNKVIGQVINFRDMTEVKKMAEELTGIKKMAWSLRAQNHEFMNKLHTISGLIQLEEYDEALKYISKTAKSRNGVTGIITRNIKNVNIAALLLAKFYKAEEMRITLDIDNQSYLNEASDLISDDDLGSIIGNLIENSFDAVNVDGTGNIYFKILEDKDNLIIEVKDNGPGIPDDIKEKIYERNFSTKVGQRGYGLYIVKSIIENANGNISLYNDEGTTWHIEFERKDGEIYD